MPPPGTTAGQRPARPTIRDVARLAGVGVGTVSRVVNGQASVAPHIREAVKRVIAEIGYAPDTLASSMRRLNTRSVGCIIRDANLPGFGAFMSGAEAVFRSAGHTMLLANPEGRKDVEIALLQTFSQRRIDGILMTMSGENDPDLLAAMAQSRMQIVLINRDPAADYERLLIDHRAGVEQATRYLLSLGHRRIALITSALAIYPGRSRVDGFAAAFQAIGLSPPMELVRHRPGADGANLREIIELLTASAPPTAIIAGGRPLLIGVMRAARQAGLRIGEDLSVICDSDSELAELATPAITAIRWDVEEMGRTAAEMLVERLHGRGAAPPRRVVLGTELVVRQSCRALAS